jgi:hypothetical protein
VNTWQGVEYLDRDRFARMLEWAARLDRVRGRVKPDRAATARLTAAAESAGYRVDRLLESLTAVGAEPGKRARTVRTRPRKAGAAGRAEPARDAKSRPSPRPRPDS